MRDYRGPLKTTHLKPGEVSLEVECLRNGTLDVCLSTGRVFSIKNGKRVEKKLKLDDDGYLGFYLNRERGHKRGKPSREVRNGKERLRYRRRRYVLVNRLVKIKSIAKGKGGKNWRQYVADLPRGVDVNHLGARSDNRDSMLELQTERANRSRTVMTDEEFAELQAAFC